MKSPKPNRVLFLSNCYGEDRSAALIASKIRELVPNISPIGMSLISNGAEYEKRGISVLMKNKTPPSGGFTRSLSALMKDVPYFYIPIRYLIELKRIRHKVKEAIVVGDVFLLVLGWLGLHRKMVFLAPAKSDYQVPHSKLEKLLMRKMAIQVFTHDELTAINLRKEGVLALFLGNPMVDGLCEIPNPPANAGSRKKRDKSQIPKSKNFIGILPGSRNEGYKNFLKILLVVQRVCELREDISFISAIPATINLQKLVTFAQKEGWMYESQSLLKGKAKVLLLYDAFVDVVAHSDIIIGLAGTANEQAAALGKPIVSFVGCGAQTS
ncbi:MAG: hypothetical protein HY769_04020 [Candidatus Stahlbacteria bacterium]|nr:hypothetical protein [Candidatus Stahlbacteria bacterium]